MGYYGRVPACEAGGLSPASHSCDVEHDPRYVGSGGEGLYCALAGDGESATARFVSVHDGGVLRDGCELFDVGPAYADAIRTLPEIAADEIPRNGDQQHFAIVVRDEDGRAVDTATLTCLGLRLQGFSRQRRSRCLARSQAAGGGLEGSRPAGHERAAVLPPILISAEIQFFADARLNNTSPSLIRASSGRTSWRGKPRSLPT